MTQKELNKILRLHKKWWQGDPSGVKADLGGANLSGLNLSRADLPFVDLRGADLSDADLSQADLRGAEMRGVYAAAARLDGANLANADLTGADLGRAAMESCILASTNLTEANLHNATLHNANMSHTILTGAYICGANLTGADLRGVRLEMVSYNEYTSGFALCCPETGALIGYKCCRDGRIVKLLIPEAAQRSSATSRKCRASKAKVLEITDANDQSKKYDVAVSKYDKSFYYRVGATISVPDFDADRWNECSTGIHFFLTRDEAIKYQ